MIRYKKGGDIVSSVISKIPYELHLHELNGKKYSYCGPNTDLKKRLNPDGTPKPGFEPVNKVDEVCMHHDYNYQLADEGLGTRHEADKIMLDELDKLENKKLNWNEWFAKKFTKGIIWTKHKLGLGINDNLQLAKELHKPITRKFKRRRVYVSNINKIWSADIMDRQKLSKQNKGYKYLLNVIDLFSKYVYSIPLKSKSQHEVAKAFAELFLHNKPQKLWTDQGSEFINKTFKKFLNEHNIELYHVHNEGKACVVERFNRTLGEMIQRHLTATNSKNYINKLQEFINEYNNKEHTTIKMTPLQATNPDNVELVLLHTFKNVKPNLEKAKFKVGDRVRIYSYKTKFDKGYKHNWTTEIFVVSEVRHTNPITYKVKDLEGEDIIGSFYTQELQLTKF